MIESIEPTTRKEPAAPPQLPWYVALILREKAIITGAPLAFGLCLLVIALGAWWVVDHLYAAEVRGLNAALVQKDAERSSIAQDRDSAVRDRDRLAKENEQLRILRGKDTPPLKQKALILANQIREVIKDWKDSDPPAVKSERVMAYVNRFGLRVSIIRDDFDQNGVHLDEFDRVIYRFEGTYQEVRTIADEIDKLAKSLPD